MAHERFPLTDTAPRRERALLVGVEREGSQWPLRETLSELERLAHTAQVDTVCTVTQRLGSPNPKTFIGAGKVDEVGRLIAAHAIDVVIFDDELTPSQQSNLERAFGKEVKVIDRTALILDIFALHARTREGRLQVRLAQNQYLYPRLRGMWAHLASNRMGGGVGSRFGEGESQLEVDRRMVRNRITSIRRELKGLERTRATQRSLRKSSGITCVALAGYTNAGKSSLLNRLTDSSVLAYDMLFATLDSTTRKFVLPEGREITLTDTVGFIQKLPTTLIESFKSTLDEIRDADIILHVIDVSMQEFERQKEAVELVLEQIGTQHIDRVEVYNKCDLIDEEHLCALRKRLPQGVFVSAATGYGIDELASRIVAVASAKGTHMTVLIPYSKGALVACAHERASILSEDHTEHGTLIDLFLPQSMIDRFEPYRIKQGGEGLGGK